MKKIKYIDVKYSNSVLTNFSTLLTILQITLILAFGIFVRMQTKPAADVLDSSRATALQNTNIMLLLGFGYLMTALKTNNLTALTYTLFANAILFQLYLLLQGFWAQIFSAFSLPFSIYLSQSTLMRGSYCVVSALIALGAVIGRVTPTDLLKMVLIHGMTYSLNEYLVYSVMGAYDAGGSTTIHVFGAYFGIAVNYVLSKYALPSARPERSYYSNVLAVMGTLFLWVYWPSFNFGVYASTAFERTQIVVNTILALTGSTVGTLIVTSMHGRGIMLEDIQHATITGGVAIGASAGILYLPPVALAIGFVAGIVSANAFHYLSRKLERGIKIYDFHGVHNTHGLPGILGGLASAVIVAVYNSGYDTGVAANYGSNNLLTPNTQFSKQAGIQAAAVAVSFAIAIIGGLVAGKFIGLFYQETEDRFYEDCTYFDRNLFLNNQDRSIKYEEIQELRNIPFTSERMEREEREERSHKPNPTPRQSRKQPNFTPILQSRKQTNFSPFHQSRKQTNLAPFQQSRKETNLTPPRESRKQTNLTPPRESRKQPTPRKSNRRESKPK